MVEQVEEGTVAVTKATPLQPRPDNLQQPKRYLSSHVTVPVLTGLTWRSCWLLFTPSHFANFYFQNFTE